MSTQNDIFELITSYKLGEVAEGRAYNRLVEQAIDYKEDCHHINLVPSKEGFNGWLLLGEAQYMEETHPDAKTKKGKWKFSKLPAAYRSAKSVIGGALDADVRLVHEGNVKGKTQLEKEVKERAVKKERDLLAEGKSVVDKLAKLRDSMESADITQLDNYISEVFGL